MTLSENGVNLLLSNLSHLSVTLALATLLTHCGKTSFDKGSIPSGSAAMTPTQKSNDSEVEETDNEAAVASEPVAVGGAFLACSLSAGQPNNDEAAVQCEFSSRDVESRRAQDLLYAFTTGASRAQSTPIASLRQEFTNDGARQVWVWNFVFQRSGILDGWLYVDIQDRARVMDASIKVDMAVPSVAAVPPPPAPAVAAPAMFRFNSGAQKLGDDGAGVAVETGCVAIDVLGIPIARSRSYTVTLSVESSLNIVFTNLCGVGTGLTNTAGSFTTAALRNANGTAVFQFNLASQSKLTYVSAKVPAGVYTLVVTPASRNGALNDFVYADLMIEGAGITVK
jgi:hypothetical protein